MTTGDGPRVISSRFVVGLMFVGVGVAFMLDNLGVIDAGDLIRYWPFGLILVGLVKLLQDHKNSSRVGGAFLCVLGVLFALDNFYLVRYDVWRWWPLAIIIAGVLIVMKAFGNLEGPSEARAKVLSASAGVFPPASPPPSTARPGTMSQTMSEVAIWSGVNRRVSSPAFKKAYLTAIMGGIEFDLRQAGTDQGEAVLEVFVLWGGIEIKVPPDWAVSNEVTPIMGGAEDQSTGTQQAQHRLIVKGVVIMGGVDIKT